ncbi:MAG: hypothetical protein WBH87_06185, partial [Acetivibrionales bacterium]
LAECISNIRGMFGFPGVPLVDAEAIYYLKSYSVILLVAAVGATPLPRMAVDRLKGLKKINRLANILEPAVQVSLLLLVTAYLVDGSFNPFLYFRF